MIDYTKAAHAIAIRLRPISATLCTSVVRQKNQQRKLEKIVLEELLVAHQREGDDPVADALKLCHLLRDRAAQMTKQEFHACLARAIGCDPSYAENVRIHFQNNPAAFLAHRTPQTQSIELLKFIFSMPER